MIEWRDVLNYEGLYQVSSTGLVRSLDREVPRVGGRGSNVLVRRRGAIMKQSLRLGYPSVSLGKAGRKERINVHRLVLEAFVGRRPEDMQGCHNDGDRTNNSVENLRWDTAKENAQDCIRHGTQSKLNITQCPKGHEYAGDNVFYQTKPNGRVCRFCRACKRDYDKRAYAARRAAKLAS